MAGYADLRAALVKYSKANTYVATVFKNVTCACKARRFTLQLDDDAGAAVRTCVKCKSAHPMGDSDEYLDEAELDECECPCGKDVFQLTVGVSLYRDSEAVRWLYLGCRCVACGLVACYGDWKNEHDDHRALLARM